MRVLHYSHAKSDTGHIKRTLAIAARIALNFPQVTQLLVTGTPQPPGSKLPNRLDFIKLPNMEKPQRSGFHLPSLAIASDTTQTMREEIILNTMKYFDPNVVFVSSTLDWAKEELDQALNYLEQKRPETKLTIGIRNINDDVLMIGNALLETKEEHWTYPPFISVESHRKTFHSGTSTSHNLYS